MMSAYVTENDLALLPRYDRLPRCEFDTIHFCAMKKLDPRIVRTRQALANSLITLAVERGYESLTIKMVTEHAGIGNRTFYRHFLSLDDLLVQILKTAFERLKEWALEAETPHAAVRASYSFIRDHQELLRVFVSLPWEHPARQVIRAEAAKIVHERYRWQETSNVPMGLSIDHILLATINLVTWYLDHIDDYTPEQMAVIHEVLVLNALERQAIDLRDDWRQSR